MCLGVPGEVIALVDGSDGQLCWVDVQGARRQINTGMLDAPDQLTAGDWVVVHMGVAMERMGGDDARALLKELESVQQVDG